MPIDLSLIDIFEGIEFLHSNGKIHGGIKLSSILANSTDHDEFVFKLTDWFVAMNTGTGNIIHNHASPSEWKFPPECLQIFLMLFLIICHSHPKNYRTGLECHIVQWKHLCPQLVYIE